MPIIMTRSVASYNLIRTLHNNSKPNIHRLQSFLFINPILTHFQLPKHDTNADYRFDFLSTRGLHYLTTMHRPQSDRKSTRNITVYASIQPGPPLPPGAPKSSWVSWVFGILVSIILPYFSSKWGGLLKWTKDVESTVDTMEQIVDVVEVVAKKVDEVAEDISSDLPEGGHLKKAVDFIEDVAEVIAKDAKFAGEIIDKVQGLEEKLVDIPNNEVAKSESDDK